MKSSLEKSVIKVSSLPSDLSGKKKKVEMYESLKSKEKILKLKIHLQIVVLTAARMSHSCLKNYSVCLSGQSVTVCMEFVIKVQKVMDSVCVSRRTLGSAVTKVRP